MSVSLLLRVPVRKSKPIRVLVADDNYSMRKVIRSFLEGFPDVEVCAVTANGTETVEAALALKPDLLIVDVVMPGLSGVEVAGLVKKSLPHARIVLFTMYGDTVGKTLIKSAGVDVVIPKSKGVSALTEQISAAIEGMI